MDKTIKVVVYKTFGRWVNELKKQKQYNELEVADDISTLCLGYYSKHSNKIMRFGKMPLEKAIRNHEELRIPFALSRRSESLC